LNKKKVGEMPTFFIIVQIWKTINEFRLKSHKEESL